jgi:hypothetical protein
MGTDPWELDFEDDESGDIERLKQEHQDKIALTKLELEDRKEEREAERQSENMYIYASLIVFTLVVLYLVFK